MSKKGLGILLCIFFGLFGLLGLLSCSTKEEKDEFMSGWLKTFFVCIVIVVVMYLVVFSAISCSYNNLY